MPKGGANKKTKKVKRCTRYIDKMITHRDEISHICVIYENKKRAAGEKQHREGSLTNIIPRYSLGF